MAGRPALPRTCGNTLHVPCRSNAACPGQQAYPLGRTARLAAPPPITAASSARHPGPTKFTITDNPAFWPLTRAGRPDILARP